MDSERVLLRQIECTRCGLLMIRCSQDQEGSVTNEFVAPGGVFLRPLDAEKGLVELTCAKCGNIDVCSLPYL